MASENYRSSHAGFCSQDEASAPDMDAAFTASRPHADLPQMTPKQALQREEPMDKSIAIKIAVQSLERIIAWRKTVYKQLFTDLHEQPNVTFLRKEILILEQSIAVLNTFNKE
jgi:hypothetical protein